MKYIKFVCFGLITNQTHTTPKQTVPLEDAKDRLIFLINIYQRLYLARYLMREPVKLTTSSKENSSYVHT